ncbi:MAG: helix-turn-helix domain-containing protein [Anaerolineales bacterium]|nr:helix-turn-helix domain-containing protein [Anaerolineales bacterium]
MSFPKADLIMHPVRFRLLQTLADAELTTQELAQRLPDVPTSSIYRHLKLLLDGEMIAIADAQLVHGIQEKRYRLAQRPYLHATDVAGMSAADHVRLFTTYVLSLLRDFGAYAHQAEQAHGQVDMVRDHVGYTEALIHATPAELDALVQQLNAAILPLAQNPPGNGRRQHKFAIITHPAPDEP